jgi:hypothetical protein
MMLFFGATIYKQNILVLRIKMTKDTKIKNNSIVKVISKGHDHNNQYGVVVDMMLWAFDEYMCVVQLSCNNSRAFLLESQLEKVV